MTEFIENLQLYHDLDKDNKISKYEDEIKLLKFDLDVMESLYKDCYNEMINQEKTINNLRQAYLDHSVIEFNLRVDNELLLSQVNSNKIVQCQCKNSGNNKLTDFKQDISEISTQLNLLKETLLVDINEEIKEKSGVIENLKYDNNKLKADMQSLQVQIDNMKKIKKNVRKTFTDQNLQDSLNEIKITLRTTKGLIKKNYSEKNLKSKLLSNIEKNLLNYKNENINLKEEITTLKLKMSEFENSFLKNNEIIENLQKKLSHAQDSVTFFSEKYKNKVDCISWLELQLNESTIKGTELCNESQDIFECVQKLLKQVKEERRVINDKKIMLQNVLKYLAVKGDISKFINSEPLFKN